MNQIKTAEEIAPLMLRLLIAQNAAARAKKLNIRKKQLALKHSRD